MSQRKAALALTAALVCGGCGLPAEAVPIDAFEHDGVRLTVPFRLGSDALAPDRPYALRRRIALPDALAGKPVDLSIPLFEARVRLVADGREVAPFVEQTTYRSAAPLRWRIPAEATRDGELDLALEVDHRWTKSGWLTTVPALLPAGMADPRASAITVVNHHAGWLAIGALFQIGATCLLIFFLDRRRRAYLWFGIQASSATVYPAFVAGLTPHLHGRYDIVVTEAGLVAALSASFQFTHLYYGLGKVPRWLWAVMGAALLLTFAVPGPYDATPVAVPSVVASVAVGTAYQVAVLARLFARDPERRVSVGLLLASWLALAAGTWGDLLSWTGIMDPLGGLRPACVGLALFALFLSLLLSRSHILSLAQADDLNAALGEQVERVEAERARTAALNEELRLQIADRSAQLFTALSLIESEQRARTVLERGTEVNGRYRVERILGSGAMGMVYEVSRLSDGSRWAMKVATDLHGAALARLAREAHVASKLTHENVVQIRDIDVSTHGYMYIVLELVQGRSLYQLLDSEGPLPLERVIPILTQVARGLEALHAAQIAHRDLKPANILLTEEDGALRVKIADFGISRIGTGSGPVATATSRRPDDPPRDGAGAPTARVGTGSGPRKAPSGRPPPPGTVETAVISDGIRARQERASRASRPSSPGGTPQDLELTGTGFLAGTPHYIAPELARGGDKTDVRADLFSFGVIGHELCTGRRPFGVSVAEQLMSGHFVDESDPVEILERHQALGQLVRDCLRFEPAARPTATQAREALEAMMAALEEAEPAATR